MYIQPNSTLRVLNDVHVDPEYHNSLYFVTLADQTTYFTSKTKYTFSELTYQRVNKGVIRVQRKADDMYDCTYMMFRNTSYGNKWFYAFITNVEYVNDITANIYYEIDELQTWLKDFGFRPCFVEREHTGSDNIGDNIVPESIETGEIVFNEAVGGAYPAYAPSPDLTDLLEPWIVLCIVDVDAPDGDVYDGVYSGATLYTYSCTVNGIQALNQELLNYQPKPDAIVGMYMCPKFCLGSPTDGGTPSFASTGQDMSIDFPQLVGNETLDGYTPKNKKLYTYPYNYLHVDDGTGNSLSLRYEFFYDLTPVFLIESTLSQPVSVTIRPCNYKNSHRALSPSPVQSLNTECLTLKGYPMCSWNMDSWKAWVAQNSLPLAVKTLETAVVTGVTGTWISGLGAVDNVLTQGYQASIKADIMRGNFNNGGVNFSNRKMTFFFGRVSVTAQMAEVIDNYFDMFGYAVKRVKYPNVHSRQYWNYIKTIGCNIHGDIPSDSHRKICKIFDDGMTFWHDPAHFEDYSLINSPI